jgi:iron complex outermembrane receptor protein
MLFFKKWSNKRYGIFASLKAVVKICVIPIGYVLLAKPTATFAQVDTLSVSKNIEMEEVVISTSKPATTYSELARVVAVISREEFSSAPISNLQELLESLTSVDIRQRGGHSVQADLVIRGGSFDQVLILINGINITDPQTGHHNLNIPIDLESIDRIELLQGPGARLYGPGAYSGAVNIITSTGKGNFAKVASTIGQYGLIKSNASASIANQRNRFYFSASSSKSDGYIENTDFNIANLFTHISHAGKTNSIDFQVGYQDKGFGAQSFYTPKYPEQYEKTETIFASVAYNQTISALTFLPSVYFRSHNDRFELFRNQKPLWYKSHNYHNTKVGGAKLEIVHISKLGRTRSGVEYRLESILSNVLGETLKNPKRIPNFSDTSYTKGKTRGLVNLYADHTIYKNQLTFSFGGLYSINNDYGNNWNYGCDISFRLWKSLSLFGSFNNAIRFPTFTDLYYNGPTNYGNINLKPEYADTYEVGFKKNGNGLNANLAIFHRRGRNVIDWVKMPEDEKWTTTNHTAINTSGIELNANFKLADIFPAIYYLNFAYQYIYSDKESGELISYYALDYLKDKVTLSLSHRVWSDFSANWTTIWQDRAGTYTHFASERELPFEPFLLINLRVTYSKNGFTTFADINNLANNSYFDLGNIKQPGLWISIGLSYTIR